MQGKPRIPITTPRTAFGEALREAFTAAGMPTETEDDFVAIGQQVAAIQGDRRPIPYAGFTVEGWLKGELLPSPRDFNAILTTLTSPNEAQTTDAHASLRESFEIALEWQGKRTTQPTELSYAMQTARANIPGLSHKKINTILVKWNENKKDSSVHLPAYPEYTSQLFTGFQWSNPTKYGVYALEQHLKKGLPEGVTLRGMYEMSLRQRADDLWESACAATPKDLGKMISAIRIRRGEDLTQFGATLASMIDRKQENGTINPFSNQTASQWENNCRLPTDAQGGNQTTGDARLCEALIQLAQITDRAPNGLSRSIQTADHQPIPWFTDAMQKQFRDTFIAAMRAGDSNRKLPSPSVKPAPDMSNAPPSTRIIQASLSNKILPKTNMIDR